MHSNMSTDGSSSTSVLSDASHSLPEGITEEEAMAIWMRRNREIAESRSRRSHADSSDSSSGNSGTWGAAVSSNVMGEYDPSYHHAYIAYQRFMNLNQPGAADAFVASSPGLALMMEQRRRELEFERRARIAERHRMQSIFEEIERQQNMIHRQFSSTREQGYTQDGSQRNHIQPPIYPQTQDQNRGFMSSSYELAAAAQIQEYERLHQAHLNRIAEEEKAPPEANEKIKSNDQNTKPTSFPHGSDCPADGFDKKPSGQENEQGKTKDKKLVRGEEFYLATPNRTQWNTRSVTCLRCQITLFTAPLAKRFLCQTCGVVTPLDDDLDTRWEEKMAEADDQDADMSCVG